MRILVTGGVGFIGANLVAALVDQPDVSLRVLDKRPSDPQCPSLRDPRVEVRIGDVLNQGVVDEAMVGVDAVVHLAAATGVVDSLLSPRQSFRTNVEGTLNLLEASRAHGVKRFVFASSNAAVGAHDPPLDESKVPVPVSPYGAGKAAGEAFSVAYAKAFGVGTVALRFSNVYGPYSEHKGSVVATMLRLALKGGPLTIHGDGSQTRDFLFVEDLCQAIWRALEAAEPGSVFQIASGVETPISMLANKIRRLVEADLGVEIPVRYLPPRAGDVPRNYSSIALASQQLGYSPMVSLDEGLTRTWEWFKARWAARPA